MHHRIARVVIVLAAFALAAPARVAIAQDTARAPTPTMLKRFAEAVDGTFRSHIIYVVAALDSLNPVAGVFATPEPARALATRLGTRWDVFGPFRQELTSWACPVPIPLSPLCNGESPIPDCVHDGYRSVMGRWDSICPDPFPWRRPGLPQPGGPGSLVLPSQVDSITVVLHLRDGTQRVAAHPRTTDAIFLSVEALDKFAFPYYARTIGLEAAADLRRRTIADLVRHVQQ